MRRIGFGIKRILIGGAAALSLLGTPTADAADLFAAPQQSALPSAGREAVSADFNGDGRRDVAVATQGSIEVRFGDGQGGFESDGWSVQAPNAWSLATGDFNRDGRPDLATGAWPNTLDLKVLTNTGSGFTVQSVHPGTYNGYYPAIYSIAVVDTNEDGWPDLAIAKGAGSVAVLRNTDGSFSVNDRLEITADANSYAVEKADLNRDGHQDLVITGGSGTYRVLGDGHGAFSAPVKFSPTSPALGVADLDADHVPDVVLQDRVLLGNGDGSFRTAGTGFPVGVTNTTSSHPFALDDFDGDGKIDLAYATQGGGGANVGTRFSPGRGDGTFGPSVNLGSQGSFGAIATDLNADDKPDLVSSGNLYAFYVRLNQRPDRTPPEISIYAPAPDAHYPVGQWVQASFSCYDDVDGYQTNCQGTANWPSSIDTSTPGDHAFTVTGTDSAGNSSSKTVHYTVDAFTPPPGRLLAFTSNDQALYFSTDDGTNRVRVGIPGRFNGGDFSPDGREFAYAVNRPTYDGVESEIRIRSVDGSNDRRVVYAARGYVGGPLFSPDGESLAYSGQDPDTLQGDVWTVAIDGGTPRQRTHSAVGAAQGVDDWSPDGRHLLTSRSSDHAYGFDMVQLDLSDDSVVALTDRPGNETSGRYSVDGQRIFYIADPQVPSGQIRQMWSVRPDGSDDRRVATLPGERYGGYDFSPDGDSLIYSTSQDWPDLVRVDLTSGASTQLTSTATFREYMVAWQGPKQPADQEQPKVSITTASPDGAGGWHVTAPVGVTVEAVDNLAIASVSCRIDGESVGVDLVGAGTRSARGTFDVVGDGARRISCRARDRNGNDSEVVASTVSIDTHRPHVVCDPPDPDVWHASNVTVECDADDATSTLAQESDATFVLSTDVGDGETDATADTSNREVCDRAGLCSRVGPYTFKVDRRSPTITFTGDQPANGTWHRTATTVVARAADANLAKLTCNLDGAASPGSRPDGDALTVEERISAEGVHQFVCSALDAAGRETVVATTVRIDGVPPDVECGVPSGWSADNPKVVCVSADATSGLDDATDGRFELTSHIGDGDEDEHANTDQRPVCDTAGNCKVAGPYAVAVDRKLPSLLLTQAPNGRGGWWTSAASLSVEAADASLSKLRCEADRELVIDEEAAGRTTLTRTLHLGAEGRHDVDCAASDLVQHERTASAQVRLDASAPLMPQILADRTPDTGSGEAWYAGSVTVSAVDRGDPALSDGAPGSGTDPDSLPQARTFSTEGVHTFRASATDVAGNASPESTLVVRVDLAPPVSQLTCPERPSLGSNATASFVDRDAASGLDGPASGTLAVDTTTAGAHRVEHQAKDRVGHVVSTECEYTVVDRTAPTVVCGTADSLWHNTNVTVTCTARDAGGLASSADASFGLTTAVAANSTNGDAPTNSRSVCDVAGNCRSAGPILHHRIDRIPPTVAITGAAAGAHYAFPPTPSSTCSDDAGGSGVDSCTTTDEVTPMLNVVGIKIANTHKLTAIARDRAGNVTTKTITFTSVF